MSSTSILPEIPDFSIDRKKLYGYDKDNEIRTSFGRKASSSVPINNSGTKNRTSFQQAGHQEVPGDSAVKNFPDEKLAVMVIKCPDDQTRVMALDAFVIAENGKKPVFEKEFKMEWKLSEEFLDGLSRLVTSEEFIPLGNGKSIKAKDYALMIAQDFGFESVDIERMRETRFQPEGEVGFERLDKASLQKSLEEKAGS